MADIKLLSNFNVNLMVRHAPQLEFVSETIEHNKLQYACAKVVETIFDEFDLLTKTTLPRWPEYDAPPPPFIVLTLRQSFIEMNTPEDVTRLAAAGTRQLADIHNHLTGAFPRLDVSPCFSITMPHIVGQPVVGKASSMSQMLHMAREYGVEKRAQAQPVIAALTSHGFGFDHPLSPLEFPRSITVREFEALPAFTHNPRQPTSNDKSPWGYSR